MTNGLIESRRDGKMRICAYLLWSGQHIAAWRHAEARVDELFTLEYYVALARTAEKGLIDAFFLADHLEATIGDLGGDRCDKGPGFEPVTLFSALSTVTSNIGFVATASTSYEEPYQLARKFASLDLLSKGRAGWNVVSSVGDQAARNFGLEHQLDHATRYQQAEEFVDIVLALWDSWEDDAFVRDKKNGVYFDAAKLHRIDHCGRYFSVAGPLNVPRSLQGHPVIVQAGSSEPGKELAARTAEVVFTAQPTLKSAQQFYADLKGRMAKYGRRPDQLLIMPGVQIYVAKTEAEASEKWNDLRELIHPEAGLGLLSILTGVDIDWTQYDIDGPFPSLPLTQGGKSRHELILDIAQKNNFTIRKLYESIAGGRGHWTIIGTPIQVADQMEEWFHNNAADGFNLLPPLLPGSFSDFIDLVIPELQARGLFRTSYEGRTLRENLGLEYPKNRY